MESKKRRVLQPSELANFQAIPIYSTSINDIAFNEEAVGSDIQEVIGLSLHGWRITTCSNSCIANQDEINELTSTLIDCAKKKLWLPEILFPKAHVTVSRSSEQEQQQETIMKLDATSALSEWATAQSTSTADGGEETLKSADAPLWERRRKKQLLQQGSDTNGALLGLGSGGIPTIGEFNFDWTYSTPFTGNFRSASWVTCDRSGIDMTLLTDRTQPILFFDDVLLYEDDLHDNGQVQLSIKIRVMPTCFYLLLRLFLRVDRVILRCRDTRIFHRFDDDDAHMAKVYKDVTWREAKWEELPGLQLPSDVSSWNNSDETKSQFLLGKLPLAILPSRIAPFSYVQLD